MTTTRREPATTRAVRMPKDQRRAQLLDAANDVFTTKGYHASAMDDIAEAAGVSKPVLYQHFASKLDLYLALLDQSCDRLVEMVQDALASTENNADRVVATVGAFYEFVSSASGEFRFVFESDLTGDSSVQKRLWRVNDEIADAIAAVITEDTALPPAQSKLLAISLVGIAQVSARYWVSPDSHAIPLEDAKRLVSSLAWRGIRGVPLTEQRRDRQTRITREREPTADGRDPRSDPGRRRPVCLRLPDCRTQPFCRVVAPVMIATASVGVCDFGVITPGAAAQPGDVDPVGHLEHVGHVVADQDHRQAFGLDLLDQVQHLAGLLDPQRRGRLVQHHELGGEGRRAGDGHRLPLAAGQGLHGLGHVLHRGDAQVGHRRAGVRPSCPSCPASGRPSRAARGGDAPGPGTCWPRCPAPERPPGSGRPVSMPACGRPAGLRKWTSLAVQEHLAGVGDQGAGQRLDQGRLAGAVVADDRQHLAGEQVDVDTVEPDDLAEGLDQPAGRQDGRAGIGQHRRRAEADGTLSSAREHG